MHRALANVEWQNKFSLSKVHHLNPSKSEHLPILIQISETMAHRSSRTKRFQFEALWRHIQNAKKLSSKSAMWILSNDYLQGKVSHAMYYRDGAKKGLREEKKKHGVYGKSWQTSHAPFSPVLKEQRRELQAKLDTILA